MLLLISIFIFSFACFGKVKHAFGVTLIAQTLYIVPSGFDVASYSFLIIFIRTVLVKAVVRKKIVRNDFLNAYVFLYIISLVSLLIFNGQFGLEMVISYTRIALILYLFFSLFKKIEDLQLLTKYVFVSVILVLIHIYTQTLFINPFANPEFGYGRLAPHGLTDQYVNPNDFSIMIVWGIGLLTNYYWVYKPNLKAYKRIFITLTLLFLILLSLPVLGFLSSRSSMLILGLAVFVSFFNINLKKVILLLVGIFLIFQLANFSISNINIPLIGETANKRFAAISDESDASKKWSRTSLAKAGITIFAQNPIFGVGIGNEKRAIRNLIGESKVSHNTYVALLSELGLFGIFFMFYLLYIWRKIWYFPTTINLFILVGLYGIVHNIILMSFTWFLLAFSYKLIMFEYESKKILKGHSI